MLLELRELSEFNVNISNDCHRPPSKHKTYDIQLGFCLSSFRVGEVI